METYNENLFRASNCYRYERQEAVWKATRAPLESKYAKNYEEIGLEKYWKELSLRIGNRPMVMLRHHSVKYDVDTGFDELERRLKDQNLINKTIDEFMAETI